MAKIRFVCNRYRSYKVSVGEGHRMIEFQNGLFETSDPDELRAIERAVKSGAPIVYRDTDEERLERELSEEPDTSEIPDEFTPPDPAPESELDPDPEGGEEDDPVTLDPQESTEPPESVERVQEGLQVSRSGRVETEGTRRG